MLCLLKITKRFTKKRKGKEKSSGSPAERRKLMSGVCWSSPGGSLWTGPGAHRCLEVGCSCTLGSLQFHLGPARGLPSAVAQVHYMTPRVASSPGPQPLATTKHCAVSRALSFRQCCVKGIKRAVTCWDWLSQCVHCPWDPSECCM